MIVQPQCIHYNEPLVSTAEAAKICRRTTQSIHNNIKKADLQKTENNKRTNFYKLSRILALRKKNKKYDKKNFATEQPPEPVRKENPDPKHVMIKPQYRGRLCPICGTPIATGEYLCRDCTAKRNIDLTECRCDDNFVYNNWEGPGEI